MPLRAGHNENGWTKRVLPSGVIAYDHDTLTHSSSTSSVLNTGFLPNEIINHLYREGFITINASWGAGTKETTLFLVAYNDTESKSSGNQTLFASAARNNGIEQVMIYPKNVYSSDGAFVDGTNIIGPYLTIKDLASSGTSLITINISIYFLSKSDIIDMRDKRLQMGEMKYGGRNY